MYASMYASMYISLMCVLLCIYIYLYVTSDHTVLVTETFEHDGMILTGAQILEDEFVFSTAAAAAEAEAETEASYQTVLG